MGDSKKTYTVIDKQGNKHTVKGDYTRRVDNGFVAIVYMDRSGCISQYKDIEKGVFHEPAAITYDAT